MTKQILKDSKYLIVYFSEFNEEIIHDSTASPNITYDLEIRIYETIDIWRDGLLQPVLVTSLCRARKVDLGVLAAPG